MDVIIATFKYKIPKSNIIFNQRGKSMNKKGFFSLQMFEMMHPSLVFIVGLLIGAFVMYLLLSKGIVPSNLIKV